MKPTEESGSVLGRASRGLRAGASTLVLQIGATIGTRALGLALGLVGSIILNRSLGAAGRGEFAVAVAAAGLLTQFANLGLHASNTYYLGQDRGRLPVLLSNSAAVSIAFLPIAALMLVAATAVAPSTIPESNALRVMVVATVPVALMLLLWQNLLLAEGDVRAFNLTDILQRITGLALLVTLASASTLDATRAFATTLVAALSALILAMWRLRFAGWALPSSSVLIVSLQYGIKSYVAGLAAFLVIRVDVLIVAAYRGSDATGLYATAAAMGDLILTLPVVTGLLLFPRLTRYPSQQDQWNATWRVLRGSAIALTVALAIAAPLAGTAVRLLYGSAFGGAVAPFLWLIPGILALGLATLINNYFAARGMPPITYITAIAVAVINIVLNLLFIPRLGINGAALASTLAYLGMLASLGRAFHRDRPAVSRSGSAAT